MVQPVEKFLEVKLVVFVTCSVPASPDPSGRKLRAPVKKAAGTRPGFEFLFRYLATSLFRYFQASHPRHQTPHT
jgi:hypothetical protein